MNKRECPIMPYNPKRDFDELYEIFVRKSHEACLQKDAGGKDKSATWLCAGDVGSGKSTLMFHAFTIVDPEPDVRRIGFNTKSFAQAIALTDGVPAPFIAHDEFNINSRNSMADGNKDLVDLLFSIRGENWFLYVNNPSVQSIDKQILLEGLVNVIIFVHKEQERYLFFTRQGLLELINTHGSASFYNMKTHGTRFAVYEGWFKPYKGVLWGEYLKLKKDRMKDKRESYVRKYAQGDLMSFNQAAQKLNVSWGTVRKAFNYGTKSRMLVEPRDFVITGVKNTKLTESGFETLRHIFNEDLYL